MLRELKLYDITKIQNDNIKTILLFFDNIVDSHYIHNTINEIYLVSKITNKFLLKLNTDKNLLYVGYFWWLDISKYTDDNSFDILVYFLDKYYDISCDNYTQIELSLVTYDDIKFN